MEASTYRTPAARVYRDHRGEPRPDAVYWVPPDASLGEVLSAWSNQARDGYEPMPTKTVVVGVILLLVVGGTLAWLLASGILWLVDIPNVDPLAVPQVFVYAFSGLVLLGGFMWLVRRRPQCSYVGTEGVAEHVRHAFGARHSMMRFEDAASMTMRETQKYTNGVYQGTEFHFIWRDPAGVKLLELSGLRFDQGLMKTDSPAWAFTEAAERRWFEIRMARAHADFETHGRATFEVGGGAITLTTDSLIVPGKGGSEELAFDQIASFRCDKGMLVLSRLGAREGLFKSEGISRFMVSEVRDLMVLLQLVKTRSTIRM